MTTEQRFPHLSHWGAFDAVRGADGSFRVEAAADDPEPASLLANVPANLDERTRVLAPHVRRGWWEDGPGPDERRGHDEWLQVSWDEVLDRLAGELERVRTEHGNEAIFGGSYGWGSAGRFHHAQSQVHRFLNAIGGYTRSVHTYSHGAAEVLLPRVVGGLEPLATPTAWPVLVEHTELFVCVGGLPAKNMQVGSGGVDRHLVGGHLVEAHARGAELVLVSPMRDDLAESLDARWIAPWPGSDTALLLALCHTVITEGLGDPGFVRTHCVGGDELTAYLTGEADGLVRDAAWASGICGVDADEIVALARRMGSRRTMLTLSWSIQRAQHGEQALWAGIALAALLGQIGLPGGGFGHGYGATANIGNAEVPGGIPRFGQGRNPVDSFIPVARISDLLLHPGDPYDFDGRRLTYPDTRLVYWAGGNPFHHHQDLTRLRRAFTRPDTIVVHDPFWTSTARHADVVLPVTTTLERDDLGGSKVSGTLVAMRRASEPLGEARDDFSILGDLAARLGAAESFTEGRTADEWLRHLYEQWRSGLPEDESPAEDYDAFVEAGRVSLRGADAGHVMFAEFRADPERHPLATPSGRIELASATIASFGYDDCPGHPSWLVPHVLTTLPGEGEHPLLLVANNPRSRLHSQLDHGATSQGSKVAGREPARMHPADAAARGLSDGDVVRVESVVGSVLAGLVTSDVVRPGVVQLSTGAWFDPSRPDVATCVHGNPNALTSDLPTSRLAQGCTGQHARVEVRRWDGEVPAVGTHVAPSAS
ncbi:molybdopterin-dependent oxidoreductase [Solicola sp. PLA-1-18]|uniref:molybdopterin-dependent oxidoreductase n=1 Tax=Solicola sp. PLA-1-18 TaxID=3380532 RepID=UPI003B7CD5AB